VLSLLVDSYNKARRYDEAEDLIIRMIEAKPDQVSYRDTLASILLNKEDFPRAANEYLAIAKEYFNQQDFKKAIVYAEKVVSIVPDMIAAHEMLFEIYTNTAKKEETIGKGLFLAKHFHEAGEVERARDYYLKILKEDPYNVEAKDGLEKVADVAAPYVERMEEAEGAKDATGKIASAEVYIKYGLLEKAIVELQDIIYKIDPDHEEAHIKLKTIYKTMGKQDKALEECLTLLRIYESSGESEKIETVINEAIGINPDDTRVREYRARRIQFAKADIDEMLEEAKFYAQQGMTEEALDVYERVLRVEPGNETALRQTGILKKTGAVVQIPEVEIIQPREEPLASFFDLEEALKEEVIEKPRKESSQIEVPTAKSFEEIFQEFQDGVKAQLGAEDYETHYNLGIAYKEMELFQEAIGEFKFCLQETPRFLDASYMTAICHKELGEYNQAIEILETATESPQYNDQRHLIIKYELGVLLEVIGEKEDALRLYSQIHATDATYRDVSEKVLNLQNEI